MRELPPIIVKLPEHLLFEQAKIQMDLDRMETLDDLEELKKLMASLHGQHLVLKENFRNLLAHWHD